MSQIYLRPISVICERLHCWEKVPNIKFLRVVVDIVSLYEIGAKK